MGDLKNLTKIGKKVVNKKTLKKIKLIKEKRERIEALKYSIILSLEKKHYELEKKINELKKLGKDVFFPLAKSHLAIPKIKMVKATFHKKDLKKVIALFKEIEEELKDV